MRFCVSSPRSSTSTIFASCFSQLLSTCTDNHTLSHHLSRRNIRVGAGETSGSVQGEA